MLFIFLSSEGLADMIVEDVSFEHTGIPSIFKITNERLREMENVVTGTRGKNA